MGRGARAPLCLSGGTAYPRVARRRSAIAATTGSALMTEGFVATLPERWSGHVWEVRGE